MFTLDVLFTRQPLQILRTVIRTIAVDVMHFTTISKSVVRIGDKARDIR